ncbi:unnamed protein product [Rotaria sp. Silwood1]|nr:unnamed protein product [Rotaria sp. Silwood1]
MHHNQAYSKYVNENNGPHKWWHHRWAKIIGISFIVLIIFAVTLSLVLKFAILIPKEPATTTATPSSAMTTASLTTSTSTLPQTTTTTTISTLSSTSTLPQTTTIISTLTSTSTTTTTTTRQSGKLQSDFLNYSKSMFIIR